MHGSRRAGVQSIAGSIHGDSEPSSSPGSPSDELSATSPVLKRDLPILFSHRTDANKTNTFAPDLRIHFENKGAAVSTSSG
jgi:hypothetical protein